jgi:hypothetical protein
VIVNDLYIDVSRRVSLRDIEVRKELSAVFPFQVHAYFEFDEAEQGRPHEMRLILVDEAGMERPSPVAEVRSATRRHRTVLGGGLHLIGPEYFHLFVEVRATGGAVNWQRSEVGWPLEVTQVPPDRADQTPKGVSRVGLLEDLTDATAACLARGVVQKAKSRSSQGNISRLIGPRDHDS